MGSRILPDRSCGVGPWVDKWYPASAFVQSWKPIMSSQNEKLIIPKSSGDAGKAQEPYALFGQGPNPRLNACVGNNGGPYDFADYGEGFFDGGRKIIAALKRREGLLDVLIYPAAFSFRHGIELYVKHFIRELAKYNNSDAKYEKTHDLKDNWELMVEQATSSRLSCFKSNQLAEAISTIAEFSKIDPTGQVFRYPEDIKGNQHLADIGIINVEVLDDRLAALHEIFKDWRHALDNLPRQSSQ